MWGCIWCDNWKYLGVVGICMISMLFRKRTANRDVIRRGRWPVLDEAYGYDITNNENLIFMNIMSFTCLCYKESIYLVMWPRFPSVIKSSWSSALHSTIMQRPW